jgi:hypothetical protein
MTKTGLQQERQIFATGSVTISPYETVSLMEGVRFFAPTIKLTEKIVLRVEQERDKQLEKIRQDPSQVEEIRAEEPALSSTLSSGALGQTRGDNNLQAWQRMIAQEFYRHLTFLADSPQVKAHKPFFMQKVVARSMGNLLGLSGEDELLTKMAGEFASWLTDERGEFIAGWGRILLADEGQFYLEKFLSAEDEETISPAGFAIKIHGRNEPALSAAEGES